MINLFTFYLSFYLSDGIVDIMKKQSGPSSRGVFDLINMNTQCCMCKKRTFLT